jgi:hypothetical protein
MKGGGIRLAVGRAGNPWNFGDFSHDGRFQFHNNLFCRQSSVRRGSPRTASTWTPRLLRSIDLCDGQTGNGHVAVKLLLAKDGVEKSGDRYQWPVPESMLVSDCS